MWQVDKASGLSGEFDERSQPWCHFGPCSPERLELGLVRALHFGDAPAGTSVVLVLPIPV
jgi:hypothetical protein